MPAKFVRRRLEIVFPVVRALHELLRYAAEARAHPAARSVHAVMTAIIAAESAGKYALTAEQGEVDPAQVGACKATLNAPLSNGGDLTPQQFMWQIKCLMQPVEYTGFKRESSSGLPPYS